ncbi:MAG: RNA polymerase sigma factor [Gemmatimonadota bacterium]
MSPDAAGQSPAGGDGTGPSPSDEALVRRVLEGHSDDYGLLVWRYQERLHRFALGMVGDPDAAADLVQDAFVRAYRKLDSCTDPSGFHAWLFQIVRNRCRDFLKDLRRSHEALEDHPELVSPRPGPASRVERGEVRRALEDALAVLPASQREAFLLKHLDDHTYREISEMLNVSMSAAKMRVHRARDMLCSHIDRKDVTLSEVSSFSD